MKRGLRALALAAAVALTLVATPALAAESPTYLALGDSVPFGYSPLVTNLSDADAYVGYPEDLAGLLDVGVRNASCPGETSGSLISTAAPDNGCQLARSVGDLHVNYKGSQLSYALAFLRAHHHTSLVTMTIGANDFFLLQKACALQTTVPVAACIFGGLNGVLTSIQANLTKIYTAIRGTGYQGTIVALTYYTTNYADPVGVFVISSIDSAMAAVTRAFGGRVADGFGAFAAIAASTGGDSCAAGLLIVKSTGVCDIHPSTFGAQVLAHTVQAALR
jgi:lysophospholipase L1-like esterase